MGDSVPFFGDHVQLSDAGNDLILSLFPGKTAME
jgi:hypothetical protein